LIGGVTVDLSAVSSLDVESLGGLLIDLSSDPNGISLAYDRAWQAALTNAEILTESESASAVRTTDLLADCPLDTSSDLADDSGNGNDYAATGSLTTVDGPFATILFIDNFDDGQIPFEAEWTGVHSPSNLVRLQGGGCNPAGYMVSCSDGSRTRTFTSGSTLSLRAQLAFLSVPTGTGSIWEAFSLAAPSASVPGFVFITIFNQDGSIAIRTNNVSSTTTSPSAPGVFPADGTPFAVQYRMAMNSTTSLDVNVEINDVTVWSHTYVSGENGINWESGTAFTAITMLPITAADRSYNTAIDNLVLDSSPDQVPWPACSDFATLGQDAPVVTVSNLIGVNGSATFTIVGTNFRQTYTTSAITGNNVLPPFIQITAPDGTQYLSDDPSSMTLDAFSSTSMDVTIIGDVFTTGTIWCVEVGNNPYCWETTEFETDTFCLEGGGIITGLSIDCDDEQLVVTGVNIASDGLTIDGPDGTSRDFTVVSETTTEIVVTLDDGFTAGSYCAEYSESRVCATLFCDATVYPLRRLRAFVLPFDQNFTMFLRRFEVLIKAGVGNSDEPDPTLTLEISRDGGETFSSPVTLAMGEAGDYMTRLFANRLGKYRIGAARITTSDPVFVGLLEAYATVTKGSS